MVVVSALFLHHLLLKIILLEAVCSLKINNTQQINMMQEKKKNL